MNQAAVIVVGAGISGLAAAVALNRRGVQVLVLEAGSAAGGAIRTIERDGYRCEAGPNTLMLSKPGSIGFLEEIGLAQQALDAAPDAKRRFVVQEGRLVALPTSPLAFLFSGFMSWRSKCLLTREPFIAPGRDPDETLAAFVRRRLGEEFLRELAGPFVSGVYAGDPEKLVTRHALPRLYEVEQAHGSLIRGAFRRRRGAMPKGRLVSWSSGLRGLVDGLAAKLGEGLRLSTAVKEIRRNGPGYSIETAAGRFTASRVVLAVDAGAAARLLAPLHSPMTALEEMPHAPMCVIHLGFRRNAVGHPLDGFGMLISRSRGIRTLGALFSSTLFPGRAPPEHVLLTGFVGGMLDAAAMALDDAGLVKTVLADLAPLLHIQGEPVFRNVIRWERAIPQYHGDYRAVLELCEQIERECPGLYLAGNYRGGISLEDCLINGARVADQAAGFAA